MRLYQNKILLISFILVFSLLSLMLFFDNLHSSDNIISTNVVSSHVEVIQVNSSTCSFYLHSGWNLVSFYCLGLFRDRSDVLAPINNSYSAIFTYDASDVNDPWKSYNPNLPTWAVQQLNHVNRVSGYWIYMNEDAAFSYSGIYAGSTIYIVKGWNLIGYPHTKNKNITDVFSEIPFSLIKKYDTPSDTWLVYTYNGTSDFNTFETYTGYWLNASSSGQWHVLID